VPVSHSVQMSNHYSPPGDIPMSPSVVRNAEMPGSNSALGIAMAINSEGKCFPLFAPNVV
jgi:hypothetical protein